jgi:hypothetical protein
MRKRINDGLSNTERYRIRQAKKGLCWDCQRRAEPGRVRCLTHLRRNHPDVASKRGSKNTAIGRAAAKARPRRAKERKSKLRKGTFTNST